MKKVLLPTDFSDNSWNAIKYALQLYKNEACHFTILHTYTPIIYQVEFMQSSTPQFQVIEAVKVTLKQKLDKIYDKIKANFDNPKHQFVKRLSFNTLTVDIDELCSKKKIDIAIMGTKGASGVKEVLFGSNTMHVIKNSKCPVLAIPSGFNFETPHDLLFPSDYEVAFKKNHIEPIIDIANLYNIRINILHVNYGEQLTKVKEQNRNILEAYFKDHTHLFHNIKNENVPEAIDKFQHKTRINLLVMLNNKRSFFENLFFKSNLNQIGFHLNVPFLVIPSKL
ncbi:universal stress protein [uncultured Winogradskyella sp.]|uniref:universal stress protein n=1 Tax=uncultured Winogradskyella sp. TaxID=395353 RepID=UPI00261D8835|nr:universal stress protein [uncultured Winogradskyella sp.]